MRVDAPSLKRLLRAGDVPPNVITTVKTTGAETVLWFRTVEWAFVAYPLLCNGWTDGETRIRGGGRCLVVMRHDAEKFAAVLPIPGEFHVPEPRWGLDIVKPPRESGPTLRDSAWRRLVFAVLHCDGVLDRPPLSHDLDQALLRSEWAELSVTVRAGRRVAVASESGASLVRSAIRKEKRS